jgi:hypothetical protein
VSDIVKMVKIVFSEFKGDNGAKIAYGIISSQVSSAVWRKANLSDEALCFPAVVLLSSHLFEILWIHRQRGGD